MGQALMPLLGLIAKIVGIDAALLLAVCSAESDMRNVYTHRDGPTPSYGICQVKEGTARMMGFRGRAKTLMDPGVNAYYAARYLKWQLGRSNGQECTAISAYNMGRVKYRNKRFANPGYVLKVASRLVKFDTNSCDLREEPRLLCLDRSTM